MASFDIAYRHACTITVICPLRNQRLLNTIGFGDRKLHKRAMLCYVKVIYLLGTTGRKMNRGHQSHYRRLCVSKSPVLRSVLNEAKLALFRPTAGR